MWGYHSSAHCRAPTAQSDGISFFFQKLGAPEEQAIETAEHLAAEHGLYSAGDLKHAAAGCGEDLLEEADREQCAPTAPWPNPLPACSDPVPAPVLSADDAPLPPLPIPVPTLCRVRCVRALRIKQCIEEKGEEHTDQCTKEKCFESLMALGVPDFAAPIVANGAFYLDKHGMVKKPEEDEEDQEEEVEEGEGEHECVQTTVRASQAALSPRLRC